MTDVLLVAIGAAIGAPTRYLADRFVQSRHQSPMPWGTMLVNVAGALAFGLLTGLVTGRDVPDQAVLALGVGFCGALTTFSAFAYETVRLWEAAPRRAVINVVLSLGLGLSAAAVGHLVGRLI